MNKAIGLLGFIIVIFLSGAVMVIINLKKINQEIVSPLASNQKGLGPLGKYAFFNLAKRKYGEGEIKLVRVLKKDQNYTSWLFLYQSDGKNISGLINIPSGAPPKNGFPVIILIRGYVDLEIYQTGVGTKKIGEYFASNGLITLAPDFIGYGESDPQLDSDILVDRFQKPVEALNLLASIKNLALKGNALQSYSINPDRIGVWGHSNGGQIGLSVLEILGMMKEPVVRKDLPTVLWAPVSLGFPESVVSFSGILDDNGLKVKTRVEKFIKDYDPGDFSIDNYWNKIGSAIEVHQGGSDDLVDINQTTKFVDKLRSIGKKVDYFTYPKSDHNLEADWDLGAKRTLEFFQKNL